MSPMQPVKLSDEDAVSLLRVHADIIPIDMDPSTGRIEWLSLGKYHIYEGEFSTAIKTVRAFQLRSDAKQNQHHFKTSVSVLDKLQLNNECVAPTGFIFGTSRCGSTLLARALARDRKTIVLGEPLLPLKFLQWCHNMSGLGSLNTAENRERLKRLILLMGRRRRPESKRYVIKFPSLGLHLADVITAAFNEVPCLFLYRDPIAVLTSLDKRAGGWDATQNSAWASVFAGRSALDVSSVQEYRCLVLGKLYSLALQGNFSAWAFLNYTHLSAANFKAVLMYFGHDVADDTRTDMERVFSVYSKNHYRNVPFDGNEPDLQTTVEFDLNRPAYQSVLELYNRASQSPRNLLHSSSTVASSGSR